jgi:cell division septation protein DedD
MLVGRQWARGTPPPARTADIGERTGAARTGDGAGGAIAAKSGRYEAPASRSRSRLLSEREPDDATPAIQDKLTFYHTLTAPLTVGPPPAPKPETGPGAARGPGRAGTVYTVQVAAVKTREQADALLALLGPEAYVVEVDGRGASRYRVRVGFFADRAAAQARAARLRAERSLAAFVTQR